MPRVWSKMNTYRITSAAFRFRGWVALLWAFDLGKGELSSTVWMTYISSLHLPNMHDILVAAWNAQHLMDCGDFSVPLIPFPPKLEEAVNTNPPMKFLQAMYTQLDRKQSGLAIEYCYLPDLYLVGQQNANHPSTDCFSCWSGFIAPQFFVVHFMNMFGADHEKEAKEDKKIAVVESSDIKQRQEKRIPSRIPPAPFTKKEVRKNKKRLRLLAVLTDGLAISAVSTPASTSSVAFPSFPPICSSPSSDLAAASLLTCFSSLNAARKINAASIFLMNDHCSTLFFNE